MKKSEQKKPEHKGLAQPKPFTPGITAGQVRQHAFELYRDKLDTSALTLDDWVMAEKDLVQQMEADGLLTR
jgi:hypothetical protein